MGFLPDDVVVSSLKPLQKYQVVHVIVQDSTKIVIVAQQ
jgi:hypothetical protein